MFRNVQGKEMYTFIQLVCKLIAREKNPFTYGAKYFFLFIYFGPGD